jgi:hypothetical protein
MKLATLKQLIASGDDEAEAFIDVDESLEIVPVQSAFFDEEGDLIISDEGIFPTTNRPRRSPAR